MDTVTQSDLLSVKRLDQRKELNTSKDISIIRMRKALIECENYQIELTGK